MSVLNQPVAATCAPIVIWRRRQVMGLALRRSTETVTPKAFMSESYPPSKPQPPAESPDSTRPAIASPGEPQLERESPVGRDATGHDAYLAFRFRDYRLYALGNTLAVLGAQMQTAAVAYEIWDRTKSPAMLSYLGLAQLLPLLLLSLPAGHVADSFGRRRIILITQIVGALAAVGLAIVAFAAPDSNTAAAWMLSLVAVRSGAMTFFRTARNALLPNIIPQRAYANAVTWNSSLFELASMSGPALGGVLIFLGLPLTYLASAALAGGFIITAALMRVDDRPRANEPLTVKSLLAGVGFVYTTRPMLATMCLDLFAVLLGSVMYLIPIFADQVLGVGPVAYGFMRAAPAIGAFATALYIAHSPPFRRAGRTLLLSVIGFGLATIVFAFSSNLWISLVMLALMGATDNISVVVRHTLIQFLTPDAMRGRVAGVNQIFIGSSNELGGVRAGLFAGWLGPVTASAIGGACTVAVVLIVGLLSPGLRRLRRLDEHPVPQR